MQSKFLLLLFICALCFSSEAQTENNSNLIEVKNNIYMFQGKGGNIGLSIGDDGIFMIDDQFATETESILKAVKKINNNPIDFLINTHHHGDHTGGNANMKKTGTVIFSHDNVRKRLESMKGDENFDPAKLPIITFSEEMNFYYNGEKIHIFHVDKAHTDGDAMVYFTESNVLHTGDVFFNGSYPYIDLDNGGTVQGCINALKNIRENVIDEETKIIPGHGSIGTIEDLNDTIDMLTFLKERVAYYLVANKTMEEVVAMKEITKAFDEKGYGDAYISTDKILQTMYKDAERTRKK